MANESFSRKLAAILSADVVGYSRLMQEDENTTIQLLTSYRELMTALIEQHHGRVVDAVGDNLLAEFASVVDAVQGAVAVQRELKKRNAQLPQSRRMIFRIGINLGDIVFEGDRIYGDGINLAAKLEAMADPGGICISRTAHEQIEDKLPLGYEYMGEKTVNNIAKPIHAFRVIFEPDGKTIKNGNKNKRNQPRDKKSSRAEKPENKNRNIFRKHLWIYTSSICFFLLINILAWPGLLWFQWPALVWGLILFIHWIVWAKD